MPEFVLDTGDKHAEFMDLDAFTRGYIEAMFFTDTGYPENEDLEHADFSELAPAALAKIVSDCEAFVNENADLLDIAYNREGYGEVEAGRDFWFTRNGHGVGFWDRKPLEAGGLGNALSDACRHREVYIYRGDDGLIYLD